MLLLKLASGFLFILMLAIFGFAYSNNLDIISGIKAEYSYLVGDALTANDVPLEDSLTKTIPTTVTWSGDVEDHALTEASGLALSTRDSSVLFSINDSGNAPEIFALAMDGSALGRWPIAYTSQHDLEDMSSFVFHGQHYLLLADTGDNYYWRPKVSLLIVVEPNLDTSGSLIKPERVINVTYPAGARDVEAVAVDMLSETVFMVSKRRVPPELYSVPLDSGAETVVAKRIGPVQGIQQPTNRDIYEDPAFGQYRSTPTAMDIKGSHAAVITYKDVYLYRRSTSQDWPMALLDPPRRIVLPHVHGLEAGVFNASGDALIITGEREDNRQRAGLYQIAVPADE